jgi:hypothetical protein
MAQTSPIPGVIFISYSHDDAKRLTKNLCKKLKPKFEPWTDELGIPYGCPDWRSMITDTIERANSFVFVASEASLKSQWCQWEIIQAKLHNKRVFVIKHPGLKKIPSSPPTCEVSEQEKEYSDNQWSDVWKEMKKCTWITRDTQGKKSIFEKLLAAIEDDFEYREKNRELADKATTWLSRKRRKSDLLPSVDHLLDALEFIKKYGSIPNLEEKIYKTSDLKIKYLSRKVLGSIASLGEHENTAKSRKIQDPEITSEIEEFIVESLKRIVALESGSEAIQMMSEARVESGIIKDEAIEEAKRTRSVASEEARQIREGAQRTHKAAEKREVSAKQKEDGAKRKEANAIQREISAKQKENGAKRKEADIIQNEKRAKCMVFASSGVLVTTLFGSGAAAFLAQRVVADANNRSVQIIEEARKQTDQQIERSQEQANEITLRANQEVEEAAAKRKAIETDIATLKKMRREHQAGVLSQNIRRMQEGQITKPSYLGGIEWSK